MDKIIIGQNIRKVMRNRKADDWGLKIVKKKRVRWIGNSYGGFAICNESVKDKETPLVLSFGVGEDVSFDLGMIEKYNAEVYAFDPTPKSIDWVKKNVLNSKFHFYEYGIARKDGSEKFYLPTNPDYVSGSSTNHNGLLDEAIEVPMKCFQTIVNEFGWKKIDVLKLDIEGSEFDVISDILDAPIYIEQICVEFHGRFFEAEEGRIMTQQCVNKLKEKGYLLIYVSDTLEECTFIKEEQRSN